MKFAHDIIIKPMISEKTMDGIPEGRYTFQVAKDANKIEIKKAVEEIFDVTVEKVTTMNYIGKMKRQGRTEGRRPSFKKAIVVLKKGSKPIEFFEGMV